MNTPVNTPAAAAAQTPAAPAQTPTLVNEPAPGAAAAADPAKAAADAAAAEAAKAAPQTDAEKAAAAEAAKKAAAPTAFEADKLTIPEGFTKDDDAFKQFTGIMADDKLTSTERGQKLLELQGNFIKKVEDLNTQRWNDLNADWQKQVKADPTVGGDKLVPTLQTISKAIDSLGPDSAKAFRDAVDLTGVGNHPAFVKGMAHFAKLLTEGGHVTGAPKAPSKSLQEEFFPNSPEMK